MQGKRAAKRTVGIAIFIILIIIFSWFVFFNNDNLSINPQHKYELNKIYDDEHEFDAISISEHLDYKSILNTSLSDGYSYGAPEFIDAQVITEYTQKYKEINEDYHKYMIYDVEAITLKNISVVYYIDYYNSEYYSYEGNREFKGVEYIPKYCFKVKTGPEKKYIFDQEYIGGIEPVIVKNKNGTYDHMNIDKPFSLTNFNGYAVEMSLSYGYICGGLCGWGFDLYQVVVLDSGFEPYLIIAREPRSWIS